MTHTHQHLQPAATKKVSERITRTHAAHGSPAMSPQEVMRSSMVGMQPADILALQTTVGNTAVQRLIGERVQRTAGAAPAAPAPAAAAPVQTDVGRVDGLKQYKAWLEDRLNEVDRLQGNEKVSRVRGMLSQIESVSAAIMAGTLPDVDKLSKAPEYEEGGKRGSVPPELIGTVRQFIERIERPVAGATASDQAQTEGSLYDAGMDWNARLGVPQYRTQSDNLAAPEATCNVTSFAMVAERLGYTREDLLRAIEKELRSDYLKTAEGRAAVKEKKAEEIPVPDTFWQQQAKRYLEKVNSAAKGYQRLRGGTLIGATATPRQKNEQMTALAADFKGSAQTEDLLDFFLSLQNISRITINSDATPKHVMDRINPNDSTENRVEHVWGPWSADTRKKLKACLDAGGGAMMSLFHKGSASTDTHIISIQSVTDNGIVVDDPYGRINPAYRRGKGQDAYKDPGKTRNASPYKNLVHSEDNEDWTVAATQAPTSDETRGNSYEMNDEMVKTLCRNLVLFHRAQEKKKR